jgi:ketosteroid isomerase-like protein|nr:nuclear transport factor 2 family protein [uncultured Psychroserpens sp.]
MNSIIENFYSAFKSQDAESMVACYHDDIVFEDPAFGVLKGEHAKNMWRMLITSQKGKEFIIEYSEINSKGDTGNAKWEAHYNFSKTGRPVHNKIVANFEFKDGKIIKHTDYFNLHKWSKQAIGFKGLLMGGTSFFKKKLNQQTNMLLTKFETTL